MASGEWRTMVFVNCATKFGYLYAYPYRIWMLHYKNQHLLLTSHNHNKRVISIDNKSVSHLVNAKMKKKNKKKNKEIFWVVRNHSVDVVWCTRFTVPNMCNWSVACNKPQSECCIFIEKDGARCHIRQLFFVGILNRGLNYTYFPNKPRYFREKWMSHVILCSKSTLYYSLCIQTEA